MDAAAIICSCAIYNDFSQVKFSLKIVFRWLKEREN